LLIYWGFQSVIWSSFKWRKPHSSMCFRFACRGERKGLLHPLHIRLVEIRRWVASFRLESWWSTGKLWSVFNFSVFF
jgi:hypothetical protein